MTGLPPHLQWPTPLVGINPTPCPLPPAVRPAFHPTPPHPPHRAGRRCPGAQTYLANGPLGRSGFLAAFSLIILSEIGDKTFFIAALLAMKVGKWVAFLGSVAALSVMTIISVGIGAVFSRVPDALKSSIPVGELAGVALLVFFGIKSLRVRGARPAGQRSARQAFRPA